MLRKKKLKNKTQKKNNKKKNKNAKQKNKQKKQKKKTTRNSTVDSFWCLSRPGYRIHSKYSDTSTPYHICSKIWTSTIHYPLLCLKIAGWVANSVDPDETPRSAASQLGLYGYLRPVCPNTYGKYCITQTDKNVASGCERYVISSFKTFNLKLKEGWLFSWVWNVLKFIAAVWRI